MAIALALSLIIAAVVFGYFWKRGKDRAQCLLNLRNIDQALCAMTGMDNIGPGQQIPGGVHSLIRRWNILIMPICPSGGTYSFVSETTYTLDGVNDINDNVRCSHAVDLGHVYPNE
jgi:hypothetical protein